MDNAPFYRNAPVSKGEPTEPGGGIEVISVRFLLFLSSSELFHNFK